MNEGQGIKKSQDFWIGILISLGIIILMFASLNIHEYAPFIIGGAALLFSLYLIIFNKRRMLGVGILALPVILSITIGGCFFIITRK
jgi:membrane-bound ClpP family serine protease